MFMKPLLIFGLAAAFSSVSASIPQSDVLVSVRDAPGSSSADTIRALRRSLAEIRLRGKDTVLKNSTSLSKSWNGATLLSIPYETNTENNVTISAGVDITCTTCYIKGNATAEFSIDGDFNVTQTLGNFTSEVGDEILNVTGQVIDYIEDYFPTVFHNLGDGIDLDDFDFPPINISFNVDVPDIPECRLQFKFDDLELYMLIDTVLTAGATYNLNLYSSNTPIGISASNDLFIGVVFSVDLILSVDTEIDISSGIHIKLEDGVGLDMALFGQNVSSITFNGANFEFLPVTVESAGGLLKAVLRIGVNAGFELSTPSVVIPSSSFSTKASAGVGVSVWANVAEFATNITAATEDDDEDCALKVEQSYQFGLGAAAGATLAIGVETWGPAPNTNIPIYTTTIADICAIQRTKTTTSSIPTISPRADEELETTTLSKKVTYTGVGCLTTGLVNCPPALQTTTKVTSTLTHVTAVPSDSEATFPETTGASVDTPVPFGTNAKSVEATTGSPVSYVAPPPPTSSSGDPTVSEEHPLGEVNGVDKRIIIGVCVGVGVPLIAAIIAGIFFCQRRRKYAAVSKTDAAHFGEPRPYKGARHH
ncbi:hypothetical protein K445DRAFT_310021 [Daldinia sp. EC12]|nr:hypothetical protein K445DRAFT_310021 [Daldinia sp. EC12]